MAWTRPRITRFSTRARWWLAMVTAAAAAFCAGFIIVPIAEAENLAIGHWLRLAYRPGCHQIPERCLDLGSGALAVCARCAGLYLGGLFGLTLSTASARCYRIQPRWLAIVLIPSAIDFAAGILGLPSLPNWIRFGFAVPLGALCGLFVTIGIADTVDRGRIGSDPPT